MSQDIINDPEYDISGILDVTASVSGDFFQPQVQGRMQLTDGALNLKKQGLTSLIKSVKTIITSQPPRTAPASPLSGFATTRVTTTGTSSWLT